MFEVPAFLQIGSGLEIRRLRDQADILGNIADLDVDQQVLVFILKGYRGEGLFGEW